MKKILITLLTVAIGYCSFSQISQRCPVCPPRQGSSPDSSCLRIVNGVAVWIPCAGSTNDFWSLTGNAGTTAGTNFVGTTDSKGLYFKTKNTTAFVVDTNQNVGIGTAAPTLGLEIQNKYFATQSTLGGNFSEIFHYGHKIVLQNSSSLGLSCTMQMDTFGILDLSATNYVVINSLRYTNSPSAGYVLTSDADGNASWTGAVYGAYYDTTTQINKGATVENYIHCNSTFEQSGVTRTDDSTFTLSESGVYQIAFTAQCSKTDGGVDNVIFYLKEDGGGGMPFTSGIIGLANANATHAATWTWVRSFDANDTIHILWQSDDADLFLEKVERGSTPNTPAVPSVTINIVKIK